MQPRPISPKPKEDLSAVALSDAPTPGSNKIQITAYGVADAAKEKGFKRHATVTGSCACHVKSFHGILSDEGMIRLDDKINQWTEDHPEVEIKFATTTIGTWHGKTQEPAMIINVWY